MIVLIDSSQQIKATRAHHYHKQIGFVPTMGNLHQGHLTLVKKALEENEVVIVSIFVNPTQFGANEDFDEYPRTLSDDTQLIEEVWESDPMFRQKPVYIFCPKNEYEIYPKGFDTQISVGKLAAPLCGKVRPGHFSGVATVVYRLLNLIRPQKAYFGLKDLQQFLVVKKMASDLEMGVDIIPCPIVRDESGLALSSRNQYLSKTERKHSSHLPKTLKKIGNHLSNKDFTSAWSLIDTELTTHNHSSDTPYHWEYLEVRNPEDLRPLTPKHKELGTWAIFGRLIVGGTPLIDNLIVEIC